MTPTEIAEQLALTGLCVCPNFLDVEGLRSTFEDFNRVHAAAQFHRAGVGRPRKLSGSRLDVMNSIRRDETFWLNPSNCTTAQKVLLERCDDLKVALNRTLYLGLSEFEGHYAAYPEGGFYQRHLDSFADPTRSAHDHSRMVSIVLYLNSGWKPTDGGQLRIYKSDEPVDGSDARIDVDPVGGTLVCFMSRDSEHEVLPSHTVRRSFAGWFSRKES